MLPQLKKRGRVSRGFIGVTLTDVTPALQRALGLTVARGAVVQDVGLNSPAARDGLRPYDVIIDVEGRPVSSNEELIREIAARQPGSIARLQIVRDGRRQALSVELGERPRRGDEFAGRSAAQEPLKRSRRARERDRRSASPCGSWIAHPWGDWRFPRRCTGSWCDRSIRSGPRTLS